PLVAPLDLGRPRHLRSQRFERAALTARAIEPESLEGIDGSVAVGPVHAERVSPDELHVLGDAGIGLADDLAADRLLHVPPQTASRSSAPETTARARSRMYSAFRVEYFSARSSRTRTTASRAASGNAHTVSRPTGTGVPNRRTSRARQANANERLTC